MVYNVYIQNYEVNSHIQNGMWREKATSVFHHKKSWPLQSGSSPGHQICKYRWLGVRWIYCEKRNHRALGPKKSQFSRTFLTFHSLKCQPSWYAFAFSFEYREGLHQSPKNFSHILATYVMFTYRTEKHRWRWDYCFLFFRFLPWRIGMRRYRFLEPSQVKPPLSSYSEGIIFQSFWGQMWKKLPEEFGGRKLDAGSHTITMVVRDCCPEVRRDRSLPGYLYPCAKYVSPPPQGVRSGWWYALLRSMRGEPGRPSKIQTNPICSGYWGLASLNHCPAVLMYIDLILLHHNKIFPLTLGSYKSKN